MKISKTSKKLAAALSLIIGLGISAAPASAAPFGAPLTTTTEIFVVQQTQGGSVNWDSPNGGDVQAMGIGLPPTNLGPQRGMALARRAAFVDAYRYLAETAQGVRVNSETTVENLVAVSDIAKTKIDAVIKGARVISEGANPDGSYYVVMSVPLQGVSGIAGATLPFVPRPADTNLFAPLPAAPAPQTIAPAQPVYPAPQTAAPILPPPPAMPQGVLYTGVIIDASGMGLEPTFSPAIYDTNGRGIYGTANVNSQAAIAKGMVQYSRDVQSAAVNSRAGSNPLIIKASAVKGGANSVHNVHVVVTPEEGDRILAENAKSGMLANLAVVFIR